MSRHADSWERACPPICVSRGGSSTGWAALSYIYLMLTGLAFWSPWLFWIAGLFVPELLFLRELHP